MFNYLAKEEQHIGTIVSPNMSPLTESWHKPLYSPSPNTLWKSMVNITKYENDEPPKHIKKCLYDKINSCAIGSIYSVIRDASGRTLEERGFIRKDEIRHKIRSLRHVFRKRKHIPIIYKKAWMHDVLVSFNKAIYPDNIINSKLIFSHSDVDEYMNHPKDYRLYFVREKMFKELIEDTEQNSIFEKSDLILVEDFDGMLISQGKRVIEKLLQNKKENGTIIFFSTKPHLRYLHTSVNFGDDKPIIHVWCGKNKELIIKHLLSKDNARNKIFSYPNPGSSVTSRNIFRDTANLELEFHKNQKIDDLYDPIIAKINSSRSMIIEGNGYLQKSINRYLFNLLTSPLLSQNVADGGMKSFQRNFQHRLADFWEFTNYISTLDDDYMELVSTLENFGEEIFHANPIMETLMDKIQQSDDRIIVVTDWNDVRGTRLLLGDLQKKVTVCSWTNLKNLRNKLSRIFDRKILIIIEPPKLWDIIDLSIFDRHQFIGSSVIANFLMNSLNNNGIDAYQHHWLSDADEVPDLLAEIERAMKPIDEYHKNDNTIDSSLILDTILSDLPDRGQEYSRNWERSDDDRMVLKDVIYVKFGGKLDGYGILYPPDSDIIFTHDDKTGELKQLTALKFHLSYSNLSRDKEIKIIITKEGFSVRKTFTSIFLKYAAHKPLYRKEFFWDGAIELYQDANLWIDTLLDISSKVGDETLASWIAACGTTAQNPNYIRRWWQFDEEVLCDNGLSIKITEVEHPFKKSDMKRIGMMLQDKLSDDTLLQNYERSYEAVLFIQHVRNQFLKKILIESNIDNIESKMIEDFFEIKKVHSVEKLTTSQNIPRYSVISERKMMQDNA